MTMSVRRITGLFSSALAALGGGAGVARAQDAASDTDLGESIANSVKGSVSEGAVSGGTQVQRNALSLGESEGLAVSDASGGSNNVSFDS